MRTLAIAVVASLATMSTNANPAVDAALALPRTEPRHYVQAVVTLLDLGAKEEAAAIAKELAALELNDQQLATLVDEVGGARLSRLGREAPGAVEFVSKAMAAANAAATSEERLQGLVDRLGGQREDAIEAIRELRTTGRVGAEFCLARIAESDRPEVRGRLREALVALDPISLPLLYEATLDANSNVRAEAANALGRLAELGRIRSRLPAALVAGEALNGSSEAGWAFTQLASDPLTLGSASGLIRNGIDQLLSDEPIFAYRQEQEEGLRRRLAAQLAATLQELNGGDRAASALAAALRAESGEEVAATLDTMRASDALALANQRDFFLAAERLCRTLGERGDLAALHALGGAPAPIVVALESPHPSVRFAAAEAIVAIGPVAPYAGSSRLPQALRHLGTAAGRREAVVASPQLARAGQTAGWLLAIGYAATPFNRGLDAAASAIASADTELVLLDFSVSRDGVRETLFRLRRSPGTRLVPVALLAADGRLAEAQRVAEEHDGVIAVPRLHSQEATAQLAERLAASAPTTWPGADRRQQMAEAARQLIGRLIESGPSFYAWRSAGEGAGP